MNFLTNNPMPRATRWVLAINVAALVAFACAPVAQEHPFAVVGIFAFLFVQVFLPACRIHGDAPICPVNIAQGFYWIQLVLVTVLIGYFGLSHGTLPFLPSKDAINLAIFIHVVGYLTFSIAYQCVSRPNGEGEAPAEPVRETPPGTVYLIVPFAVIGLIGLLLTYGGIAEFLEYASSPTQFRQKLEEETTPQGAAGSFLKHFLGFAVVLAWSWWLGKKQHSNAAIAMVTAGVAAVLLAVNFSYNRGTMLGPLVGLAAAFSVHVWRIPFKGVVLAGAAVLSAAFLFGAYRSTNLEVSELSTTHVEETWDPNGIVEFVQIYASGPQLTGYMIEQLDLERKFYGGSTLLPSIVYPIPVLGKPYRDQSGTVIFNELIYGDVDNFDQIIPLDGELYVNFHLPGVVVGNVLLGVFLAWLQRRFITAQSAVESYAWLMMALWTVFPGSLPVISQIYVYSFWPIYTYFAVKFLWSRNPSVAWQSETPTAMSTQSA